MTYESLKPLIYKLDPENAHALAEFSMRTLDCIFPGGLSFFAKDCVINDEILNQEIFNLNFYNPVGLAGGFDKNATMIRPLSALGFGFLEYGTFTPKPQNGNEKPRLFRLVEQESIQNAMGFNNKGKDAIAKEVKKVYPFSIPLVANIGKNKITPNEEAINDYIILLKEFKDLCDLFVINISSPNTKNLRDLQSEEFVSTLFSQAKEITNKPVILKIAPDMNIDSAISLCKSAISAKADGIIMANTSIDYSLIDNARTFGGISGKLITQKSATFFKEVAKEIYQDTILIASGGIDSAELAYERIKNGASLVQIYTAMIFKGPSVVKNINQGLIELLKQDGFNHISQAIGVNFK
ncbi:quinone-dependent dihydroorotate dehydrogenase [Campylobacter lari]|uniref:quinone-dependent dihydroorotate dehydrogenase n=1 Tax=Campylobacter lari TaxID=201 RepID=UPI001289E356|nr:quinone-dependent dihydroorotate dehydrogenase [Campylobacter lari]EAJ0335741.1 quinone-dependent dihydroorotate dehydrogenase [Campylobacter lari]EAK0493151.1 quinone-dependent dihydroorotate dehydrogenase [Campylobacter lari]EAK9999331.1 quinone-dependent dihydroorotate dehydrogenase [Campylobacter lari]EFO9447567.1 quinone-dependent dihydroorotate dehydrogenase [Campylobacter lari]MCR2076026.1 quinone-dependent dihydroorotate dehydrogenase [Campylobacter lari subsp. concheus]